MIAYCDLLVKREMVAILRDLEAKMREAAGNLDFEEAALVRDKIKRLKLLDLEFANEALTSTSPTFGPPLQLTSSEGSLLSRRVRLTVRPVASIGPPFHQTRLSSTANTSSDTL